MYRKCFFNFNQIFCIFYHWLYRLLSVKFVVWTYNNKKIWSSKIWRACIRCIYLILYDRSLLWWTRIEENISQFWIFVLVVYFDSVRNHLCILISFLEYFKLIQVIFEIYRSIVDEKVHFLSLLSSLSSFANKKHDDLS